MNVVKRILGFLILIALLILPAGIALYYGGGTTSGILFFIGTVVWVAIAWGAVHLIRSGKFIQILGWLILFIISFVPAVISYNYGGYPTLVGKIYLGVLAWVTIAWGSMILIRKSEQEI